MADSDVSAGKKVSIWNKNFVCVLLANAGLAMSHNVVNPLVSS